MMVAYYSLSGRTAAVAERLRQLLDERQHEVDVIRLVPRPHFSPWHVLLAVLGRAVRPGFPGFDPTAYDALCIGSPVWGSSPAPAVNGFIDALSFPGPVHCFVTCQGMGAERAMRKLAGRIAGRGMRPGGRLQLRLDKEFRPEKGFAADAEKTIGQFVEDIVGRQESRG